MTFEQAECLRRYIDAKADESVDAALSYRDSIDADPVKSHDLWDVFLAAITKAESEGER